MWRRLEQAIDLTRLGVNVDVEVARGGRETGNGLYVSGKRIPRTVLAHVVGASLLS